KNVDRFDQSDCKRLSRLELKPSLLDSTKNHLGDDGSSVQNWCNRRYQRGNNRDKNHISAEGHSALQHNRNPFAKRRDEAFSRLPRDWRSNLPLILTRRDHNRRHFACQRCSPPLRGDRLTPANVRLWPKADMSCCNANVRLWG